VGRDPLIPNIRVKKLSSDPSGVTRSSGISQHFRPVACGGGGQRSEEPVKVHETAIRRPAARQDIFFFIACRRCRAESLSKSVAHAIGPFLVVDAEHDYLGQAVERVAHERGLSLRGPSV
jgi:hypothetical protein